MTAFLPGLNAEVPCCHNDGWEDAPQLEPGGSKNLNLHTPHWLSLLLAQKLHYLRVYAAYSGYARDQLRRMRNHNTLQGSHADLIARYGYDTKNAMHLIRLLLMAKTALQDGRIDVYRSDRNFLLAIRNGHYSARAIQEMAEALDADCQVLLPRSVLPREPDTAVVEQWLMTVHRAWIAGDPALL